MNAEKAAVVQDVIQDIFSEVADMNCVAAPSGVPEAPYNEQTHEGALNRAKFCQQSSTDPQALCVGVESGLAERGGRIFEETWVVILKGDKEYVGYSSGLLLPDYVTQHMKTHGVLHNVAMGAIDKELGIQKGTDTWSTYSGGLLKRKVSLREAARNAAIQMHVSPKSLYAKSAK